MATVDFLLKLCPTGRMLLERFENQHFPLSERRKLFEETGSYDTPDEAAYKRHVEKCPVCKEANQEQ